MINHQPDFLMIYTSKTGRIGGMVEAIERGILAGGSQVMIRTVEEVSWSDMLAAKGIIVGTPVRFGDIDWQIKKLFDVTSTQGYPGPLSGKVGGAFTSGSKPGSGAELTLLSMLHILLNHGMVIQGNAHSSHYGPVALNESSPDEVASVCNAWGLHWASLVQKLHRNHQ